MKKFTFLVLTFFLINYSCTKTEYLEREIQKDLLIEQVSDVAKKIIIPGDSDDFLMSNCNNPYDLAGIITNKITWDILIKARDEKTNPNSLRSEFISKFSSSLSASNLNTDTLDYSDVEFIIKDILIDIYINEGFNVFTLKSKEIENIVNESLFFNKNQKMRVLVFSSVLRHGINTINTYFTVNETGKSGPWGDCFIAKLRELQDCGNCWTERIFCIFSWPTCLGLKALDCGIAAIL